MFFTGGWSNYFLLCSQIAKETNLNYVLSQTLFYDNINGLKRIIAHPE